MRSRFSVLLATLSRSYGWMLNGALIALGMVFVALGINQIIVANMVGLLVVPPPAPASAPVEAARDDSEDLTVSDLFTNEEPVDEEVGDPDEETVTEEIPDEEPGDERTRLLNGCLAAELPAVLVGTMSEADPAWSFAIVQLQGQGRTVVLRAGEWLGEARITSVQRNLLVLDVDGEEQCLAPNMEATMTASLTTPVRETSTQRRENNRDREPPTPPTEGPPDLSSAVRHLEATHYEIDGPEFRRILDGMRDPQAMLPEITTYNNENGRPIGLRLEEVQEGTPMATLGLRSGDVLTHVNGHRVSSLQEAMGLIDALRTETHVEVSLRRGQTERTRVMTYDIRQ